MTEFIKKLDLLYELGCNRNWHPKNIERARCGQYYMTGNSELDGKQITINIENISKHMNIAFVDDGDFEILCDQLYDVLLKILNFRFKGTEIKMCNCQYKVIKTYKIS